MAWKPVACTLLVLTGGRQLSFDPNHILEHTLNSIIHPILLFHVHTLDLVLWFQFFQLSK